MWIQGRLVKSGHQSPRRKILRKESWRSSQAIRHLAKIRAGSTAWRPVFAWTLSRPSSSSVHKYANSFSFSLLSLSLFLSHGATKKQRKSGTAEESWRSVRDGRKERERETKKIRRNLENNLGWHPERKERQRQHNVQTGSVTSNDGRDWPIGSI